MDKSKDGRSGTCYRLSTGWNRSISSGAAVGKNRYDSYVIAIAEELLLHRSSTLR